MKKRALVLFCRRNGLTETEAHKKAERIISGQLGYDAKIRKTPLGAPYIDNANCFMSISHSDGLIVCALSPVPVGIDTEPEGRKISPRIVEKFTSRVRRNPVTGWTVIESSMKLFGHGLDGLSEFEKYVSAAAHRVRHIGGNVITLAFRNEDVPVAVTFKEIQKS